MRPQARTPLASRRHCALSTSQMITSGEVAMGRPRKDAIKVPTKLRILTSAETHFGEFGYDSASLAASLFV